MQTRYEHTQPGTAMLFFIGIPALGLLAIVVAARQPAALLPLIPILALMLLTMAIFRALTVRVDAEQVTLHFGLNAFRRAFPLREIQSARVVRAPLWYGLGIHFISGGKVYNVSGRGAVELALPGGRRAVIGSDEPEALARAIEAARRAAG